VEAAQLDRDIRALDPTGSNRVLMPVEWTNSDLHSNSFAAVIPATEQHDLTNDELATAAATNAGMPNPEDVPLACSTWDSELNS
jgi:hypothetical protein